MKRYLFAVLFMIACIGSMQAQDSYIVKVMRFVMHDIGGSPIADYFIHNPDTTHWRNPKSFEQSVLSVTTEDLNEEQKNEKLRLLGFFCNPKIVKYQMGGLVEVNTKRSLYTKNGIDLRYRKFVKDYYDKVNKELQMRRQSAPFDENATAEQFKEAEKRYSRLVKE